MFWGGSRRPFFLYSGYAMNSLLEQISHHGYLLVFLMVFAEAAGLPAPAALALVAAGAAAAAHILAVSAGALHGLGVAEFYLRLVAESGDVHFAVCGVVL